MINYRFPSPGEFAPVTTKSRTDIGHNTHIALDEGRGEVMLQTEHLFRLIFQPSSEAPRWSELGIDLADKGWLDCRSIHAKFRAAALQPARVHVALRLHAEPGFHDHFASGTCELGPDPQHFGVDFTLSPRLLDRVHACALHLFFDNRANTLDLHDLVVTGFR